MRTCPSGCIICQWQFAMTVELLYRAPHYRFKSVEPGWCVDIIVHVYGTGIDKWRQRCPCCMFLRNRAVQMTSYRAFQV